MEASKKLINRWGKPLNFGLMGLFVFVLLLVAVYLSAFNAGLSRSPDNWSAFGAFFGGVLGPSISLVTLLALLRTIDLQLEQSAHFVEEGANTRISEYKASQLQLIDQQILMYERMIDRYDTEGERIFALNRQVEGSRVSDLDQVDANIQKAEREVAMLIKLSVAISLGEFESIEQLRLKMQAALYSINSYLYQTQ